MLRRLRLKLLNPTKIIFPTFPGVLLLDIMQETCNINFALTILLKEISPKIHVLCLIDGSLILVRPT